jgi:hypothetical protein
LCSVLVLCGPLLALCVLLISSSVAVAWKAACLPQCLNNTPQRNAKLPSDVLVLSLVFLAYQFGLGFCLNSPNSSSVAIVTNVRMFYMAGKLRVVTFSCREMAGHADLLKR